MNATVDFWSPDFLRDQMQRILGFYAPRALDPSGGFFHSFRDDGRIDDPHTRHLVSSARFVVNHAMAFREFGHAQDREAAAHGLSFIERAHALPDGGYAWLLRWPEGTVLDATPRCYGLAFVLLAQASALETGLSSARAGLYRTWEWLEQRFWEPMQDLYADEIGAQGHMLAYRGQNANMHLCEALQAAYVATADERFLNRAITLAHGITQRQAQRCGGLLWEHYDAHWQPDWNFNRDHLEDRYRPWGYQIGHLTEWGKLMLTLDRLAPDPVWLPRACAWFDAAWSKGWDDRNGGLVYSLNLEQVAFDDRKYHWVQAESLACAALLYLRTGEQRFSQAYGALWAHVLQCIADPVHGAWYRVVEADHRRTSDHKSPLGKTDHHGLGACQEILGALRSASRPAGRPPA